MTTAWTRLGAPPTGDRLERISTSPQFDRASQAFANPLGVSNFPVAKLMRDWLRRSGEIRPKSPVPVVEDPGAVLATAPASGLRITWLGHSTMLVEIDGHRVLTDPVWCERSSPLSWAGPRRFFAPPLAIDALPELDAVVISHDHYDHLDADTIPQLADRVPLFVTPLGVGSHLERWGVPADKIVELDWWEEHRTGSLRLVATPSRHFSGRGPNDHNRTLWCSFAIVGPEHRVYFSGDTGMFPGFRDIGQRLGPFDVAMIESGAYNRMWPDVHLGPEQAIEAFRAVRGELFMPIHWGTFNLGLHGWTEPAERVLAMAAQAQRGGLATPLVIPRPGESFEPAAPPPVVRWWPELPWETAREHPVRSSGIDAFVPG